MSSRIIHNFTEEVIATLSVWCDHCNDFHRLRDCRTYCGHKGISYACPKDEEWPDNILLIKGAQPC